MSFDIEPIFFFTTALEEDKNFFRDSYWEAKLIYIHALISLIANTLQHYEIYMSHFTHIARRFTSEAIFIQILGLGLGWGILF